MKDLTNKKNNKTPKINVAYVAKLSGLSLNHKSEALFEKQLENILDYVSQLNEINSKNIEPIGHITGLNNITRDDQTLPSLSAENALKNAPKVHNGFFEVDAIFEE